MPDALKDASSALVYANDFNGSATPIVNTVGIPAITLNSDNATGIVGSVATQPWANMSGINTSFTISMDLVSFTGNNWADVVSIHATSNMSIEQNDSGDMYLYVGDNFAGSTVSNGFVCLGSVDSLIGKSLTVVMDAVNKEVVAYVDNNQVGIVTLPYEAEAQVGAVDGLQFGSGWGGGHGANEVVIDNLYIWNKALTANEVASIPEPATATLSLLALAGLAARRRRH
ncbi:MAG: hypothetical protein MJ051_05280 [Akkermansia sp.]|nr:hypothetical protein [Akkermansia sp.]